ncbi:MAG: LysE family translocator [Cellvibrionaceae bacterium]
MENYWLFVIIAVVTVLSPGPGVVLTITNAVRYGTFGAIGGILGIAIATFIVAGVSATSLGILLATSSLAFSIMKYIGAAYLIYLGIKLWRAPLSPIDVTKTSFNVDSKNKRRQFLEGFVMQLTNPKAVFFFMSIFPQFVNHQAQFSGQFFILVATYSSLVVAIHLCYAAMASSGRDWISSGNGRKIMNRLGGGTFMCFGVGLATANK